jgi:hypothetical protein
VQLIAAHIAAPETILTATQPTPGG